MPVPFHWNGQRLRVREPAARDYDSGAHGSGVATMRARRRGGGLEGSMRSVWRFEREDGQEYAVCDSGFVPFAVGAGARRRVPRMPRQASLWVLYPGAPAPTGRGSPDERRFAALVDRTCERADRERPQNDDRWDEHVRWHAAEWGALRLLRPPPSAQSSYEAWLTVLERRARAAGEQLERLRAGDLDSAARIAVAVDLLEAERDAAGRRLGFRGCSAGG